MNISEFRSQYAKRPPRGRTFRPIPHEFDAWSDADGVAVLLKAPVQDLELGKPPRKEGDDGVNRYIWVIDDEGIRYVIEQSIDGRPNPPKHTNLTGGGEAYVGGELWFSNDTSIYLSGGSGRYPPRNELELENVVRVFASYGYAVTSLGWDKTTNRAKRHRDED